MGVGDGHVWGHVSRVVRSRQCYRTGDLCDQHGALSHIKVGLGCSHIWTPPAHKTLTRPSHLKWVVSLHTTHQLAHWCTLWNIGMHTQDITCQQVQCKRDLQLPFLYERWLSPVQRDAPKQSVYNSSGSQPSIRSTPAPQLVLMCSCYKPCFMALPTGSQRGWLLQRVVHSPWPPAPAAHTTSRRAAWRSS